MKRPAIALGSLLAVWLMAGGAGAQDMRLIEVAYTPVQRAQVAVWIQRLR